MSKKLDINENHLLILTLFTRGYHNEYYIREIAARLPISHGTAQTILCDLEAKQVLKSTLKGKIRIFRVKPTPIALEYLTFVEIYKKIGLLEETPYISELMEKIDPYINGCAVIFGSYAKGTATKESDLDLFVAGQCDRSAIEQTARKYAIEVNIVMYTRDAFSQGLTTDHLIREILDEHIIWKETEFFVRTVMAK
jgi:predicted nucleotidyltransferase